MSRPPRLRAMRPALSTALVVAVLVAAGACTSSPPPGQPGALTPVQRLALSPADETAVPYGTAASQVLDVRRPVAGRSQGTIVYVHGGSFTGGWRSQIAFATPEILGLQQLGWSVVSIDYRLLPSPGGIADQVADVRSAVAWVRAGGRAHGLDPTRVVVVGHSAGGTLAELAAIGPAAPGRPDGWVAISGVADIGRWSRTNDVTLPTGERLRAVSPLTATGVPDVPGWVIHSRADPYVAVGSARALVGRLRRSGASVGWDEVRATPTCHPHSATCGMDGGALAAWLASLPGPASR